MNKDVRRIHFYTGKVAKLGETHWTKRDERWYRRLERLNRYKVAMHLQFNQDFIKHRNRR
jgi:hypothetical protein